eukprot:gene4327-biopygen2400
MIAWVITWVIAWVIATVIPGVMVGRQQCDDEPHLAKEQHGPITTQNTVQRICPIR